MCKNLMIAGLKKDKSDNLWKFAMAATPFMSENDKDGVGYAAQTPDGVWGERWLNPKEAWLKDSRKIYTKKDADLKTKFKGVLQGEPKFNEFGDAGPEDTHAIILHARMATCEKNLANVHPFVLGKTALIHNGVIHNHATMEKLNSTCDSEVILTEYVAKNIMNNPERISEVTEKLDGYYACGVLTQNEKKEQFLDIFKSSSAMLYAAHVKQLDAVVYCTSEWMLKSIVSKLKWQMGHVFKFVDEKLVRINAVIGDVISTVDFKTYKKDYSNYHTGNQYGHYKNGKWSRWDEEEKKTELADTSTETSSGTAGVDSTKTDEQKEADKKEFENTYCSEACGWGNQGCTHSEQYSPEEIRGFTTEEVIAKLTGTSSEETFKEIIGCTPAEAVANMNEADAAIMKDPHGVKGEGYGS